MNAFLTKKLFATYPGWKKEVDVLMGELSDIWSELDALKSPKVISFSDDPKGAAVPLDHRLNSIFSREQEAMEKLNAAKKAILSLESRADQLAEPARTYAREKYFQCLTWQELECRHFMAKASIDAAITKAIEESEK